MINFSPELLSSFVASAIYACNYKTKAKQNEAKQKWIKVREICLYMVEAGLFRFKSKKKKIWAEN